MSTSFDPHCSDCHRRQFLRNSVLGSAAFFTTGGAFAEALTLTPKQAEGPFYPDKLPLDTDNDLILINDKITPAVGEITHFHGTVRDVKGNAIRNATVEIWEADNEGNYIHSGSRGSGERDGNFQGYGRFLTGISGEYYFRTIKPVPYTRRTPHIHVAVSVGERKLLTTQCYIDGYKQNEKDNLLGRAPAGLRHLLMVDFKPLSGSTTGELTGQFDIVVGLTPED